MWRWVWVDVSGKAGRESVSRGLKSSAVSEHMTNLAKEISRQNAEDATWLILVVYARVLQKKGEPEKNSSVFKQNVEKHRIPKTVSPGGKEFSK